MGFNRLDQRKFVFIVCTRKIWTSDKIGVKEGNSTYTTFEKARKYLAQPNKDHLLLNKADYNELFAKLVKFH